MYAGRRYVSTVTYPLDGPGVTDWRYRLRSHGLGRPQHRSESRMEFCYLHLCESSFAPCWGRLRRLGTR
uniref:Uncharacterized protein n=1 Tax=Mycobacterium leprae TaxID=1769 RepID=Q49883_MYCLR|nr:unknown [Mycobacterium leprae]